MTWFATYLPFLATFFCVLNGNIHISFLVAEMDPGLFSSKVSTWIEQYVHNESLQFQIHEHPWIVNFAAAYLMADLVPTTFIALGLLAFVSSIEQREL